MVERPRIVLTAPGETVSATVVESDQDKYFQEPAQAPEEDEGGQYRLPDRDFSLSRIEASTEGQSQIFVNACVAKAVNKKDEDDGKLTASYSQVNLELGLSSFNPSFEGDSQQFGKSAVFQPKPVEDEYDDDAIAAAVMPAKSAEKTNLSVEERLKQMEERMKKLEEENAQLKKECEYLKSMEQRLKHLEDNMAQQQRPPSPVKILPIPRKALPQPAKQGH